MAIFSLVLLLLQKKVVPLQSQIRRFCIGIEMAGIVPVLCFIRVACLWKSYFLSHLAVALKASFPSNLTEIGYIRLLYASIGSLLGVCSSSLQPDFIDVCKESKMIK